MRHLDEVIEYVPDDVKERSHLAPPESGLGAQYWGQDLLGLEDRYWGQDLLGMEFVPPESVMARHRAGARLGEEIMMIEGVLNMAPTELEGAIFGNSLEGLDDLKAPTTVTQFPAVNSPQPTTRVQTIPTAPTTLYTPTAQIPASSVPQATINSLEKTVNERRQAIVKADAEAQKQYGRVKQYDAMLKKPLPASEKARIGAARDIAAAKAVRYGKTAAVGQALTKNATAQVALLTLAKTAEATRQYDAAQTLVKAAVDIGTITKAVKAERAKQVEKFQAAAATEKVKFASLRLRQTARDFDDAQRQGASENQLLTLKTMTTRYRDALTKAKQEAGRAGIDPNLILEEYESDAIDSQMVVAALYGLDDLGSLKSWVKKKTEQAKDWVKDKAKDVGEAVEKAYDAAKDLVKDGVCALASNPAVKQAAQQAVDKATQAGVKAGAAYATGGASEAAPGLTSKVGGKAGAGAAEVTGKAVDALAKAACPKEEPTVAPTTPPIGHRLKQMQFPTKKKIEQDTQSNIVLPVVIAGGAAAAAFFLL